MIDFDYPVRVEKKPQRAIMRPRFTLLLLYLFAFFFLFCLILVGPVLVEVLQTLPPGPEQEEAARIAAQEAASGKLGVAFVLAIIATGVGIYKRWLPGTQA